jgi:hypothetical protein
MFSKLVIVNSVLSILSFNAFAFQLKDGNYVSKEGCQIEIATYQGHTKYSDGDKFISATLTVEEIDPDTGLKSDIYKETSFALSSDFFEVKSTMDLCGEIDDGMPTYKPMMVAPDEVTYSCGDSFSRASGSLKITGNATGEIQSFEYIFKLATLSLPGGFYIPGIQSETMNLSCTDLSPIN